MGNGERGEREVGKSYKEVEGRNGKERGKGLV